MPLGRPEMFHDKVTIRLRAIDRAIAQYQFSASALRKPFSSRVDEHTVMFVKGFGNEVNLLSATRELFFASRELLDVYLGRLSAATKNSGNQTPKDCLRFLTQLASGQLDSLSHPAVAFFKTNLSYVFYIRKVRNELKSNPSNAEFFFNTDHFELRLPITLSKDEQPLFPYLETAAKVANDAYVVRLNLDIYFPEVREFWVAVQSQFSAERAP